MRTQDTAAPFEEVTTKMPSVRITILSFALRLEAENLVIQSILAYVSGSVRKRSVLSSNWHSKVRVYRICSTALAA